MIPVSYLPDTLSSLLSQVLMRLKRQLVAVAEAHHLTVMQTHTLLLLSAEQPAPMHSLSAVLGCDASNITGIIDRLENHRLIARQDSPRDRRVKMITLTPQGQTLQQQLYRDIFIAGDDEVKRVLSQSECRVLRDLLAKLQQGLPLSAG